MIYLLLSQFVPIYWLLEAGILSIFIMFIVAIISIHIFSKSNYAIDLMGFCAVTWATIEFGILITSVLPDIDLAKAEGVLLAQTASDTYKVIYVDYKSELVNPLTFQHKGFDITYEVRGKYLVTANIYATKNNGLTISRDSLYNVLSPNAYSRENGNPYTDRYNNTILTTIASFEIYEDAVHYVQNYKEQKQ
jgi:hypothetical protein